MKVGLEPAEPIGIYDVPAPPDAAPQVRSIGVANIGAVYLVKRSLDLQNAIYTAALKFIHGL